uniref:Uncharacterized protein n=1 Tax=Ditylenchus dipsaci TaxID=166011 RepID=A0A915CNB2_9BILA
MKVMNAAAAFTITIIFLANDGSAKITTILEQTGEKSTINCSYKFNVVDGNATEEDCNTFFEFKHCVKYDEHTLEEKSAKEATELCEGYPEPSFEPDLTTDLPDRIDSSHELSTPSDASTYCAVSEIAYLCVKLFGIYVFCNLLNN